MSHVCSKLCHDATLTIAGFNNAMSLRRLTVSLSFDIPSTASHCHGIKVGLLAAVGRFSDYCI